MRLRTVGQLAKDGGVAIDTVRYYERIGLIQRPASGTNRWRRYPEEALIRLRYLREGRSVGFTVRELQDLSKLSIRGAPRFCNTFDAAIDEKLRAIDTIIARLSSQRARLESFSKECRNRRSEHRCPIQLATAALQDPRA